MSTARIAAESLHFKESVVAAVKLVKSHLDGIIHDYKLYLPSGRRGPQAEKYDEYRSSLQLVDDYLCDLSDELTYYARKRIDDAYQSGVSEEAILEQYDFVDDELLSQRDFDPGLLPQSDKESA